MKKYLIVLWHKKGLLEFTLIGDKYPSYSKVVSFSGIKSDDIIEYEVHD